jgi:hypothetical protein
LISAVTLTYVHKKDIRQPFYRLQEALSVPVLPDGTFSNQKYQCGSNLEGLAMQDAGIFYGHFVYFTAKLYILWPFGIF